MDDQAYNISVKEKEVALRYFDKVRGNRKYVFGKAAQSFFNMSGLSGKYLFRIWQLADLDGDNQLDQIEFCIAFHLTAVLRKRKDLDPPKYLPRLLFPLEIVGSDSTSVEYIYGLADAGKIDEFNRTVKRRKLDFNAVRDEKVNVVKVSDQQKVIVTKVDKQSMKTAKEIQGKEDKDKQKTNILGKQMKGKRADIIEDSKSAITGGATVAGSTDSSAKNHAARKIQARVRGSIVRKESDSLAVPMEDSVTESESESESDSESDSEESSAPPLKRDSNQDQEDEYENDFSDDEGDDLATNKVAQAA